MVLRVATAAALLVLGFTSPVPSQSIAEFPLPAGSTDPFDIVAGPDGNLWFTEFSGSPKIGRITTAGTITEFPAARGGDTPAGIVAGPDGNLWFTQTDFEFGIEAYILAVKEE